MRSAELKERIEKAQETVNKKMLIIEKHKVQAEKKLAFIQKNGWELDVVLYMGGVNYDACRAIFEYEQKLDDIKEATKKLEQAHAVLANWIMKYNKQVELETKIATEMPAIFKTCQDELAERWTQSDIYCRNLMKQKRAELDYIAFRKLYPYSKEMELLKTDKEFYNSNLREAEVFIIDLYNRVKSITGEVTDWADIHYGGNALNGLVRGKNGMAEVETILAGGYNIQRLHMRVLVKEIKAK